MDHVAIVGASLAGLRATQALRRNDFAGRITLIGAEPDLPYDRPPLSKQILAGSWEIERTALIDAAALNELDVELMLDTSATGLDIDARELDTGGTSMSYDGLIVATGARPRTLPGEALSGVHTLRTLDDAVSIRAALDAGARQVVVIGAGFIGAEVAASCRGLDRDVTVVDVDEVPMRRGLGEEMGSILADLHRAHGVDLRLGLGVDAVEGDANGRVSRVALSDGSSVPADLVVVGIGVIPNTEWLQTSGLTIDDGVVCDASLLAAPGVVAAGDVARWPNELFDEIMRVEHWENAVEQGGAAAKRLLTLDYEATPFIPVPWFWSDQYDRKLQVTGRTNDADEVRIMAGDVDAGRFVAGYRRGERLMGAFGMNWPRQIMRLRAMIAESISFEDAVAELALAGA